MECNRLGEPVTSLVLELPISAHIKIVYVLQAGLLDLASSGCDSLVDLFLLNGV